MSEESQNSTMQIISGGMSRTQELEVIKFREKASCIKIEDSQVVRGGGRRGV